MWESVSRCCRIAARRLSLRLCLLQPSRCLPHWKSHWVLKPTIHGPAHCGGTGGINQRLGVEEGGGGLGSGVELSPVSLKVHGQEKVKGGYYL